MAVAGHFVEVAVGGQGNETPPVGLDYSGAERRGKLQTCVQCLSLTLLNVCGKSLTDLMEGERGGYARSALFTCHSERSAAQRGI